MSTKLSDLLSEAGLKLGAGNFKPEQLNHLISGITSDSRQVKEGSLFVAIPGVKIDGNQFVSQAINQGACAIVTEHLSSTDSFPTVPVFHVKNARLALASLASKFFRSPSTSFQVVGVTGTSGKTTSTYILESIFDSAGFKPSVIGTNNYRIGNRIINSGNTTPGAVDLQAFLSQIREEQSSPLIIEVSSHALDQHRVSFVAFDAACFTNLSSEHQDYHPNMEEYFEAKSKLFLDCFDYSIEVGKKPFAVVNVDDSWGLKLYDLIKERRIHLPVYTFGVEPNTRGGLRKDFHGDELTFHLGGIEGNIHGPHGRLKIESSLIGQFNGYNLLGAIAIAKQLGIQDSAIQKGIRELETVPGRLEPVVNARGIHVYIDYAHKPDALEKVLGVLNILKINNGDRSTRIITVFGCGGDRDRKKRPIMGRISVENSDEVIVTSDNPRTEDPNLIIKEIMNGISPNNTKRCTVIPDRKRAIFEALDRARDKDIVLIAGKGHEDYQILGSQKIHFDDRETVCEALGTS